LSLEPGGRAPGGTYVAGKRPIVIIVRTDAVAENLLARELAHLELQLRVKPGHVPAWFSEGVATYVSLEPLCRKDIPVASIDLEKVDRNEDWIARTNEPGARVPITCRARQEVASWLDAKGRQQFLQVLAGVSAGRPFAERYETPTLPANPLGPEGFLTKEAIKAVVSAHVPAVKVCYVSELANSPNLTGRVDVRWTVEPDGHVSAAEIVETSLENEPVESCIVRQTLRWTFPRSRGTATVQYPFVFLTSH
jgi:hypothetical protein